MKKNIYLILLLAFPFICSSQTLFRSGIFLHHSTGGNIWGPNGSSTSIPQQMTLYNNSHGYTGSNAITMSEQWWPDYPNSDNNEWEIWHRIFDNQVPTSDILSLMSTNKIVVIKSCYPSSEITGLGQPTDTLTYTIKSVYNYKWHWRSIVHVMAQHPENFFVIWTNAPLVADATNPAAALLAKSFCTWAKDTLALGLDPGMGAFPPNIYVFDYFSKLTNTIGYELPEYAVSSADSHPNATATALVAPLFVNEIFDAAIAYEQGGSTLSVSPSNQQVTTPAESASFAVTSNTSWTVISNQTWCTVTLFGDGNGTITATYTENTAEARTANISVTVTGLPAVNVTLTQDGVLPRLLQLTALFEGLYAGSGTMNQAHDELGPHFGAGIADVVTIELHNAADYGIIEYSLAEVALSTAGIIALSIPTAFNGSYYLTVKHRNSIEITSSNPVLFAEPVVSYAFDLPVRAFGANLLPMDGHYVIYSGDVNQDGFVDTADMSPVDNNASGFVTGYLASDINGDGMIDTADMTIIDNNGSEFISALTP